MAFRAADIQSDLVLDRTRFTAGLREAIREGERFEAREFKAKLDANRRPLERSVAAARRSLATLGNRTVRINGQAAVTRTHRQLATLRDRTVKVTVRITGAKAMTRLHTQLKGLRDRSVKVKAGVTGAAAVTRLQTQMRGMRDRTVKVKVTGEQAVTRLGRGLATLRDRTVKVNVRGNFRRELVGFRQFTEGLLMRLMTLRIAGVAALLSLVGPAGAAASAIGGVGVAVLGILGPLGALGVAMSRTFKKGGPDIKALKQEMAGFGRDFDRAFGPGALEALRGFTSLVGDLRTVLSPLREDFTKLGKAGGDAFRGFGRQLSSPRFQDFYKQMTRLATKAVPPLARALRNLLDIFRNVARAAGPLMIRSLKQFADWLGKIAKSSGETGRLRKNFDAGAKALGALWRIAMNVSDVFKSLFKAASADGVDFLGLLGRTTKRLAEFFASKKGQADLGRVLSRLGGLLEEMGKALPTTLVIFGRLVAIAAKMLTIFVKILRTLEKIPAVGPVLATLFAMFVLWKGPLTAASILLGSILAKLGLISAARVPTLIGGGRGGGVVAGGVGRGGRAAPRGGSSTGGGIPAVFSRGSQAKTTAAARTAGTTAGRAGFLAGLLASITRGRTKVMGKVKGLFSKLGPLLKRIPGLAAIGGVFAAAFAKVGPAITKVLGGALKKVPMLFTKVLPRIVGAVLGWPVAIALLIYTLLPKKVKDAIWGAIKKVAGALKTAGVWIAKGVAKGVSAGAKAVWGAAKKIASGAWKAIKGFARRFLAVGKLIITKVWDGMKAVGKKVWGFAKTIASKAWKAIKGFAGRFYKVGKLIITKVWGGMKAVAGKVWGFAKKVAKGAWEAIKGFFGRFYEAGKKIIEKVIAGIKIMTAPLRAAAKGVFGVIKAVTPGSEPRDSTSPLARLGRRGHAVIDNFGKGIRQRTASLKKTMLKTLEVVYAPMRDAAKVRLAQLDAADRRREGPAPTRAQREGEIMGRMAAARFSTDDEGRLLNNPPPGVARRASAEEREMEAELRDLRREFEREDIEKAVSFNVSTLLPSDPQIMRQAQRGMARSVGHGRRRRRRRKRKV